MTLSQFRKLKPRDFTNGAVTDEIELIIEQRDSLLAVVEELLESAEYWCEYDVPLGIVERMRTAAKVRP